MFRHLDDPTPPVPSDSMLEAVARRASRLRRRRHRLYRTVTVFTVVVVLGALVAVGLQPRSTPTDRPVQTSYQFDQEHSPLQAGTSVPTSSLFHVIFVSPDHGFALAEHGTDALLASTSDGGSRWQVVNDLLPPPTNFASDVEFDFTDLEHGYLWAGGVADGSAASTQLWVTDDGGVSWTRSQPGGPVLDVEPIGTDLWALISACTPGSATSSSATVSASSATCPVMLESSLDAGATWTTVTSPGLAQAPTASSLRPNVELARITPLSAYALAVGPAGQPSSLPAWLAYTDDGGASWSGRPVPCGSAFDFGAELAASSTYDLWLLCGGEPSAGNQPKQLFRSSDGGVDWLLASETDATSTSATLKPGQLPLAGYIAPYAFAHQNFAVLSPSLSWLFPSRAGVFRTTDGGTTWTAVSSLAADSNGDGSSADVTFISATQGWACELGVGLATTTDGVRWRFLGP